MTTKRRFIKHLPLLLAGLALGLGVFINTNSERNNVVQQTEAADYYSSITATGGTTLLGQLHDLSNEKHTTYNAYNAISTTNCINTDPYENTSYVMDFYSGAPTKNQVTSSGTVGWNREHVWCQNLSNGLFGESGAGADIQHLRPTIPQINSDRGNKKYGELNNSGTASTATDANGNTVYGGYYTSSTFQPMANKKGDAARIIMYLYMHYNKASNVGGSSTDKSYFGTLNFTHVMAPSTESAAIQLLLTWNSSDPVDSIETTRNEEAAKITGCRNPFIDHPEYANLIWGSGSSSTDPSASISPSSTSVAVDGTVNLTATLSNVTNANSIAWTSSDTNKATVAKGTTTTSSSVATVTGKAAGTATIYCQYNETTIGSATVTVTTSGGGGSSNEYSLYSGTITEGDYLVVYDNKAMKNSVSSNRLQYEEVSPSNNKISTSDSSLVWHIATNSNYWTIYNSVVEKYAAGNGTKNQATLASSVTDSALWTVSGSSTYEFVNKGNTTVGVNANLRENTTYGFACYSTSTGGALSLYKKVESSSKTLSSIAVSTAPTKTSYNAGEYFDPTGLVIRRNYSDGTYDTYSYAGHTSEFDFSPSTSTALTTSNTSVTISYGGKSCNQAITVAALPKALSSISVSGQTTSFTVGDTFSFGGTVTATFNDSTTNDVTSSASFSGYNMSQVGNQTVTVSYTYSGATKTTTYTITVNPKRTVLEETSSQGTITWSSSDATVSTGFTATVTNVQYTYYENNSLRLGTGSGGGQIRIDTNVNIVSVVVTAKAYSDTRKGNLSVGGQNINVQNTDYITFDLLTLTTPTTSLTISTASSSIRINIQSIVVNCLGSTDISSSSDCLGLESFVENYMHMDYTQNLGYCKDNTHHYYSTAKAAFNALNTHQRSLFVNNSAYAAEWARLAAWASANGESINSNNQLTQRTSLVAIQEIATNSNIIVLMAVILVAGISAIGMYVYINKKRIKE